MMRRDAVVLLTALYAVVALGGGVAHAQEGSTGYGIGRADPGAVPADQIPPRFDPRRYTEDYRYLSDPARSRDTPLADLKLIPLDRSHGVTLTLGGEARVRGEAYDNALFRRDGPGDQSYVQERLLPYAELRVGDHVRVFGQLEAAWSQGQEPGPSPLDETGVDPLQGFVEVGGHVGETLFAARIGRQVLSYGDGSLIDSRYGPNVLQSFDGAVLGVVSPAWRVDLFWARPVEPGLDNFDDQSREGHQIWGLAIGHDLTGMQRGMLDLLYVGFENDRARWDRATGVEERHTLALRHAGARGRLDWKGELIRQIGSFGAQDIEAHAGAAEIGYAFPDLSGSPRLHVNGGVASGDDDPEDGKLGTFNALFPRGQYFSDTGVIGPYNLINLRTGVQVSPAPGLRVDALAGFYWRQSREDAVYRNGGGPLFAADAGRSRYVATQYEVTADWTVRRGLDLRLTLALFDPGAFVEEAGGETIRFVGLESRLWF